MRNEKFHFAIGSGYFIDKKLVMLGSFRFGQTPWIGRIVAGKPTEFGHGDRHIRFGKAVNQPSHFRELKKLAGEIISIEVQPPGIDLPVGIRSMDEEICEKLTGAGVA